MAMAVTTEDRLVQRAHASPIPELGALVAFLIQCQAVIAGDAALGADQTNLGRGAQSDHIDRARIVARETHAGRGGKPAGGTTILALFRAARLGVIPIGLATLAIPDRTILATATVKHQIVSATTDRRRGITAVASQLASMMLGANIVITKPMVIDEAAFAIVGRVAMGI